MKYIFILLSIFMLSCSNEIKTESEKEYIKVANIFTTNYRSGNIDEASKYCTPKMNRRLITLANNTKGSYIDSTFKFNYLRDSLIDNKAYVFYQSNNIEGRVFLINNNNKWLVSYE